MARAVVRELCLQYAALMAQPTSDRGRLKSHAELPVACALEASDGAARLIRWRALFEMSPPEVRRDGGQIVVRFADGPAVAVELDALVTAERVCCSFVDWHVVHEDGWRELQIRGTADGLDAITAIFGAA